MYTIEVYFVNQPDEREPFKTFTCEDSKLPDELSTVQSFIIDTLNDNPNMLDAVEKVIINGNKFSELPTLQEILRMPGYNPAVKPQLLKLLQKYPTVQAVCFDGHTSEYRGVGGDITVYASGDKHAIYNLAESISSLYNVDDEYSPTYNLVSTVFAGVDSGYTEILKRGVDF